MDLELGDKHVLVTGGSCGIGLACARAFLQEGARVRVVSRSEDQLIRAAQDLMLANPLSSGVCFTAVLTSGVPRRP